MKISIVTSYYNRYEQFLFTLKSIEKSKEKDIEFIVVDDGSDDSEKLDYKFSKFEFLKVYRIDKNDKNYINPCIPFNLALKQAVGDIIVIQNPECVHIGDILNYISNNISDDDYFSFSCYSTNEKDSLKLRGFDNFDTNNWYEKIIENILPINNIPISPTKSSWYNHPIYRPVGYHFLSAIKKTKLDSIGYFNEQFAQGISYDDDEFLYRIKKHANVKIISDLFCIHQYHKRDHLPVYQEALLERNRQLYQSIVNKI